MVGHRSQRKLESICLIRLTSSGIFRHRHKRKGEKMIKVEYHGRDQDEGNSFASEIRGRDASDVSVLLLIQLLMMMMLMSTIQHPFSSLFFSHSLFSLHSSTRKHEILSFRRLPLLQLSPKRDGTAGSGKDPPVNGQQAERAVWHERQMSSVLSERAMREERVSRCLTLTPDVVVRWHISHVVPLSEAFAASHSTTTRTGAAITLLPLLLLLLLLASRSLIHVWHSSRRSSALGGRMTMTKQVAVIAAACRSNGIGINGSLPWRLKREMAFFTRITSQTEESGKRNAVVMGRKSWESIPPKYRPLANRVNVILSRNLTETPVGADFLFPSLDACLMALQSNQEIEKIFVIGGQQVYADAISSKSCDRIYLTRIDADFVCDTFFPDFDEGVYHETVVAEDQVPSGIQEENGIKYQFHVYERVTSIA